MDGRKPGATLLGLSAVLMWSALTGLSVGLASIPPFELMALTFLIGGVAGVGLTACRGRVAMLNPGWPVWLLGVAGIFGDYALFFLAIRMAPAAQASLLSYLWPLFAVVFSALLLREKWRTRHLVGAGLGIAAVILTAGDPGGLVVSAEAWRGYALAVASALVWAGYSTLSRRLRTVQSEATYGFCLGVAVLSGIVHVITEPTVAIHGVDQWLRLALIGIGPAGLAFAAWDVGLKHGDMRTLTVVSYAIPVLSTVILVVLQSANPTASLGLACVLIAVAGVLAAPASTSASSRRSVASEPFSRLHRREPEPSGGAPPSSA